MVEEEQLRTVTRLLGVRTYSAAVNLSLEAVIKQAQVRDLFSLVGQGVWEGDLGAMRADRPTPRRRRQRR